MDNVEKFFNFINERHNIFLSRFDNYEQIYSFDPYITQFHYTNVYRELDRGTVWYIMNIAKRGHDGMGKFFDSLIYRIFNKIETYEAIEKLRPSWIWDKQ